MSAVTAAVFFIRLGTLPFAAYALASFGGFLSFLADDQLKAAQVLLLCHASAIAAFIGGLQQAAALSADRPWLVAASIALAVAGMTTMLSVALHGGVTLEPLGLATAYGCQLFVEAVGLPVRMREALLADARRKPMIITILALLACALDADATGLGPLAVSAAACAAVGSLAYAKGGGAMRHRVERHLFDRLAVGTLNPCKLAAARRALGLYEEVVAGGGEAVSGFAVPSGVSEQPLSLDETARGARNRAAAAHAAAASAASAEAAPSAVLGASIESGLLELWRTLTSHRSPSR